MPKNPKRDPLGSLNVFYKPKTLNNSRWYPLTKFKKFWEKVALCRKNSKCGTRWSHLYFELNVFGLVRDSNPRSPASLSLKISRPRR